jgi:hypothetical protein
MFNKLSEKLAVYGIILKKCSVASKATDDNITRRMR